MLKRTEPSAPRPATTAHDDIVERALALIQPKPEQTAGVRKRVVEAIARIHPVHGLFSGDTEQERAAEKRECDEFAGAMRTAIAALDRPTMDVVSGEINDEVTFGETMMGVVLEEQRGHHGTYTETARRVHRLRKELAALAAAAEADSSILKAKCGRRTDPVKWAAAIAAYETLRDYGIRPSLYKGGTYFQLAAVLYEGVTGRADEDFSRACTQVARVWGKALLRWSAPE
jgi:hypothetical protein